MGFVQGSMLACVPLLGLLVTTTGFQPPVVGAPRQRIVSVAERSVDSCFHHQRRFQSATSLQRCFQSTTSLYAADRNKNLSASGQERRAEEKRRLKRKEDVVIGKTSAVPGESDYSLNIKKTEEEWKMHASDVEQLVAKQTEKGMELLKMLRLEEASLAFDDVFTLKPSAYLWQAGIAKYYMGELQDAADIFSRNAVTFECKFGAPATEERIWRHACELKFLSDMSRRERVSLVESTDGVASLFARVPEKDFDEELYQAENRKVLRLARDLFTATVEKDYATLILSRAKLRSIGGTLEGKPRPDPKMWKLNAWFYLGLHYDALGQLEESKSCMKRALLMCPSSGNGSDIVHTLPMLHMSQRDWFDDDVIDEEHDLSAVEGDKRTNDPLLDGMGVPAVDDRTIRMFPETDPVIAHSIKTSVGQLKLSELQEALRVRGFRATQGSKGELQDRLFDSLMKDDGLRP